MHPQRIAVAIAAGVGLVCSLTPWADPRSLRAVGGDELVNLRWATLLCCAAVVVGMVAVRRTEPLTPGGKGLCRLAGGLTTLLTILAIVGLNSGRGSTVSVQPTLYLLLMAGAAVMLLPNIVPARSGTKP